LNDAVVADEHLTTELEYAESKSLRQRLRRYVRKLKPVERWGRKMRDAVLGLRRSRGFHPKRPARDFRGAIASSARIDTTTSDGGSQDTILVLGHDAQRAGAQMILLQIVAWLRRATSLDVRVILGSGGQLLRRYRELSDVIVLDELARPFSDPSSERIVDLVGQHAGPNLRLVYANTVASGRWLDRFSRLGVPVITHVHELEQSIRRYFTGDMPHVREYTHR
jgi:hypothetical protein